MPIAIVCSFMQFNPRASAYVCIVGMKNKVCNSVKIYAFQTPCQGAIMCSSVQLCKHPENVIGMRKINSAIM